MPLIIDPNGEAPPAKKCVVCGAQLKAADALKCAECKEYQSAVRRAFENINFSALTALVSVSTVCFGFLYGYFELAHSKISVELEGCSQGAITIGYENSGNRAGWLRNAELTIRAIGQASHKESTITDKSEGALLVKANSSDALKFLVRSDQIGNFIQYSSCEVELSVEIKDFGRPKTRLPVSPCACGRLI